MKKKEIDRIVGYLKSIGPRKNKSGGKRGSVIKKPRGSWLVAPIPGRKGRMLIILEFDD